MSLVSTQEELNHRLGLEAVVASGSKLGTKGWVDVFQKKVEDGAEDSGTRVFGRL